MTMKFEADLGEAEEEVESNNKGSTLSEIVLG